MQWADHRRWGAHTRDDPLHFVAPDCRNVSGELIARTV